METHLRDRDLDSILATGYTHEDTIGLGRRYKPMKYLTQSLLLAGGISILFSGTGCVSTDTNHASSEDLKDELVFDGNAPQHAAPTDIKPISTYGAVKEESTREGEVRLIVQAESDSNPWDSGAVWALEDTAALGEKIHAIFSVKGEGDIDGKTINIALELAEAPYTKVIESTVVVGPDFQESFITGLIGEDTAGRPLNITMHLGTRSGTLHLYDVQVLRSPSR